jgi:RND family efflux transporter MFP subunit
MTKAPRLGIDASMIAVFIAIAVCLFSPGNCMAVEGSGEPHQDQAPPPDTSPFVGNIVFWRTSKIATPVTGRIASLPVRIGEHVNQGDVVAEIDTVQLKANLAVAQSELLNAQSALSVAEAQLVLETTTRDRLAKLKGSPGFREASLQDANNSVAVAAAAVEQAKSLIEVRKAEVARQQVNVNLATIKAPFDGVVVSYMLTVGGLVTDYDPSILLLVDYNSPEIEIEVPIEDLPNISVGMAMTYSLHSGHQEQAKVRVVLPRSAPDAKTRTVRLEPEKPETSINFSDIPAVIVYVPKR